MKLVSRIFAAALILVSSSVLAHEYRLGELEIGHPWSRATLPAAKVGGGYLTITNEGASPDRLVGGSSPVAGRVEIHSMEIKDGIMNMRPMSDGLEVPAHGTLELAPGGYHLMLMDLKEPFKEGQRISLTLEFENAGTVDVELAVEAARPSSGDAGGSSGHSGHGH
jgi:copper(I)-binding protein